MTKKELEQQNAELLENLRQLMAENEKPSAFKKFWNWGKPYIIPFILGMILGLVVGIGGQSIPLGNLTPLTIEKQAALGGAVIPFPNVSPSPSHSTSPQGNSPAESTASSLTNTCAPPSPPSLQVDDGQRILRRSYSPLLRRTW